MRKRFLHRLRPPFRLLFPVLLIFISGCTTFTHDWELAGKQGAASDEITGRWQGRWKSHATSHTGSLRCMVTRKDDGSYEARFRAIYQKIFAFSYRVPLNVEKTNAASSFEGEANLGWYAGGVYKYAGQADGTNFFSTYTNRYDHGIFQMGRP